MCQLDFFDIFFSFLFSMQIYDYDIDPDYQKTTVKSQIQPPQQQGVRRTLEKINSWSWHSGKPGALPATFFKLKKVPINVKKVVLNRKLIGISLQKPQCYNN